jgi:hypothetical protein|tara:strand:+ start:188 stop:592 length:405 start_codon:yes stop_codon:yes gene_type:complete
MATVIDEMGTRLATAISGTLGTNVFQSMMPATPNVCAVVYETGGMPGIEVLGTAGITFEQPGVQLVFRGNVQDYESARTPAQTAFNNLKTIQSEDLSGTRYDLATMAQQPFSLGPDEQGRPRVAFNMILQKEVS